MWTWWWIFVLFLILLPMTYGWGYRRWGPPYPSFYRRRRVADPAPGAAVESGWGLMAVFVWLALMIGMVWLFIAAVG